MEPTSLESSSILHLFTIFAWISIPTVMYGGYVLLGFLSRGKLSAFQMSNFRAGHAHAGVLQSGGFFLHLLKGQPGAPSWGTRMTRAGAVILATAVLVVLILGQFTPVVSAWLLRQPINAYSFNPPPDFDTIKENVVVHKDIPYNEQGTLLDIYSPKNIHTSVPVILYIHGGGFIGGKKENTQAYAMTLASAGYVVANMNYDLAPEYKYPVQVMEANQAFKFLEEHVGQYGGDANRLFLGGNSSGSHIAGQLAVLISNQAFADQMGIQPSISNQQLKGVVLYDGVYNLQKARALHSSVIDLYLWSYTGIRDFESFDRIEDLSIPEHVTPDFPPAFMTVGDGDRLEPQSIELIQTLKRNGVDVEAHLFTGTGAGLGHDFMMDLDTRPARQILGEVLDFLKRHSAS